MTEGQNDIPNPKTTDYKKIITIIIIVVLVGAAIYFFINKKSLLPQTTRIEEVPLSQTTDSPLPSAGQIPSNQFVKKISQAGNDIYILRVKTTTPITESEGNAVGEAEIGAGETSYKFSFSLKGADGKYPLGVHREALRDYPASMELADINQIRNLIPTGKFIQLRMTTSSLDPNEKSQTVGALDSAAQNIPVAHNINLKLMSIEVVK